MEWWTYTWCYQKSIKQYHFDSQTHSVEDQNLIGNFVPSESTYDHEIYRDNSQLCFIDDLNPNGTRYAEVTLECCSHDLTLAGLSRISKFSDRNSVSRFESQIEFDHSEQTVYGAATPLTYIASIVEPRPCTYMITICADHVCNQHVKNYSENEKAIESVKKDSITPASPIDSGGSAFVDENSGDARYKKPTSIEEQSKLLKRAKDMFYHGYNSYMEHAFPQGELKPISCDGRSFDLIKIPAVTLIDALDTLVIVGDYNEFRISVIRVIKQFPKYFDFDVNVSVFETTIRILGGLLSAHLMAIDPKLGIYDKVNQPISFADRKRKFDMKNSSMETIKEDTMANNKKAGAVKNERRLPQKHSHHEYNGELLELAINLGNRLLPAFETKTGIPFGTVNLRHGVPHGETKIASTAGAGSLLVELEVLSLLSGDVRYGMVAFAATQALFERRSDIGLLGKHINTETGQWHESLSGIGSNSDSFYEYLLKSYFLFRREELYQMFTDTYRAIKKFVFVDSWFTEVDMFSGRPQRKRVENLDAFWPGVEAMLGFSNHGADQLNSFYSVWTDLGFLPEEFDYVQWQQGKALSFNTYYPLRPELIESTYHQYRTTGDRSWIDAGKSFLESLEKHSRTSCGYATVSNMATMDLHDSMPSFFLSETCKYLVLLFDENNFIHYRPYIFSTEAHPFDAVQVNEEDKRFQKPLNVTDVLRSQTNRNQIAGHQSDQFGNQQSDETLDDTSPFHAKADSLKQDAKVTKKQDSFRDLSWFEMLFNKRSSEEPLQSCAMDENAKDGQDQDALATDNHNDCVTYGPNCQELELQSRDTQSRSDSDKNNARFPYPDYINEKRFSSSEIEKAKLQLISKMDKSLKMKSEASSKDYFPALSKVFINGANLIQEKIYHYHFEVNSKMSDVVNRLEEISSQSSVEKKRKTDLSLLPTQCPKRKWWDSSTSYNSRYLSQAQRGGHVVFQPDDTSDGSANQLPPPTNSVYSPLRIKLDLIVDHFTDKFIFSNPFSIDSARQSHYIEEGFKRTGQSFETTTETTNARNYPLSSNAALVADRIVRKPIPNTCTVPRDELHDIASEPHEKVPQDSTTLQTSGNSIGFQVLKTVEVNMGVLSDFVVKVYPDGFLIYSVKEKNSIEISNIGKNVVLIREKIAARPKHSKPLHDFDFFNQTVRHEPTVHFKTIVGNLARKSASRCRVVAFYEVILGSSPISAEFKEKIKRSFFESSCSIANFGSFDPQVSVESSLVVPRFNKSLMCQSINRHRTSKNKRWWQWSLQFSSHHSDPAKPTLPPEMGEQSALEIPEEESMDRPYMNRIVIAKRGECLFEEKALASQAEGALGLIVHNTDDGLFIMAGRRESEATSHHDSSLSHKKSTQSPLSKKQKARKGSRDETIPLVRTIPADPNNAHGQTNEMKSTSMESDQKSDRADEIMSTSSESVIPVVMLSASDGRDLKATVSLAISELEDLKSQVKYLDPKPEFDVKVRMELSSQHLLLGSEYMGNFEYPKLWLRNNLIYIIGSGNWGSFLTSQSPKEEWQLFLMSKKDLMDYQLLPVIDIRSHGGEWKTTTVTVMANPVSLYWNFITRRCPSNSIESTSGEEGEIRLHK